MQKELKLNAPYTAHFYFYEKNEPLIPDSATITVSDNRGEAVISAAACDVSDDGDISFAFGREHTGACGRNFKAEVKAVKDSAEYYQTFLFDIVPSPISSLITDEDLYIILPGLRDITLVFAGCATDDGTTMTLIDSRLTQQDEYWKGGILEVYQDSAAHYAKITDYTKLNATITFSPAAPAPVAAGTAYRMRSTFQDQIDRAFEIMRQDIRNSREIMGRFIDSDSFRIPHIYKTLEIVCRGRIEEEGDRWSVFAHEFAGLYRRMLRDYTGGYDRDDDGMVSPGEERASVRSGEIIR